MKYLLLVLLPILFSCKSEAPVKELEYQVRMPKNEHKALKPPLLVLLHGLGSNENDLFSFSEYLDPRLVVVCPRGPITLQDDKYSWYNLKLEKDKFVYTAAEVEQSRIEITQWIKSIAAKYDVDMTRIYIGGFSQGAIMSLNIGLGEPQLIKGVIALSGLLLPEMKSHISKSDKLKRLKVFMSHGREDKALAFSEAEAGAKYLKEIGVNVETHWYDTNHTISQDNFRDFMVWIGLQLEEKNTH